MKLDLLSKTSLKNDLNIPTLHYVVIINMNTLTCFDRIDVKLSEFRI